MVKYFEMFVNFLWGLPIIVIILGAGIYFTFKSGFFQVFYLKHIFSETILKTIKTGNKGEGNSKGLITPFDAVATAIAIGGPGALFWEWGTVWVFADFTTAIPTFINVGVILTLSGTFFKLFKDYKKRYILKEDMSKEGTKLFFEEN